MKEQLNKTMKELLDRSISPINGWSDDQEEKEKMIPTSFRLRPELMNYLKMMAAHMRICVNQLVVMQLNAVMKTHTIDSTAETFVVMKNNIIAQVETSMKRFIYDNFSQLNLTNTNELFHEVAVIESWYFTFATPPGCGKSFAAKEVIADAHANNWQVAFWDHATKVWISDPSLLLKATCELDPEIQNLLDLFSRAVVGDMPLSEKEQVEILNATRKISELESKNNDNSKSTKLIVIDEVCLLPNSTFLNSFYPVWLKALKQQGIKLLMLNRLDKADGWKSVGCEHPLIQHIDTEIVTYIKESQDPSWRLLETKVNF